MENTTVDAMTDETSENSSSHDVSSLSDMPVMIYNAVRPLHSPSRLHFSERVSALSQTPFVEDNVQRQLIALNGPSSHVCLGMSLHGQMHCSSGRVVGAKRNATEAQEWLCGVHRF